MKIKFRIWDKELEEMLYQEDQWLRYRNCIGYLITDLEDALDNPKRFKVMQYAGLKDKNNEEIYKGDIFWSDHSGEYTHVEYQEGAFYIIHTVTSEKTLLSKENSDWIVKGNIYENPELLEGQV